MKDEIKLLNEKLVYLNDGNRRLHGMFDERGNQIQNLENKLDSCENQNGGNQVSERMIEGIDFSKLKQLNFQLENVRKWPKMMKKLAQTQFPK